MKIIKYLSFTIALTLLTTSCKEEFKDLENNPNQATGVPPSLILTGIENDLLEAPWSLEHRWNQYWACNYYYYGNQEYNWTNSALKYQVLEDVKKMEEEARKAGAKDVNPYSALAKVFRAMLYVR